MNEKKCGPFRSALEKDKWCREWDKARKKVTKLWAQMPIEKKRRFLA